MAVYIEDYGDEMDSVKWDFPENTMKIFWIGKYPYKAKSLENAQKLATIRKKIDILCKKLNDFKEGVDDYEIYDRINVFLGLHNEYEYDSNTLPSPFFEIAQQKLPTSRYLLSEIPKNTGFDGLCKPKMRYYDKRVPSVGLDGKGRALYRDIFLNLNKRDLDSLIIHELAHSMCNHIKYRDAENHADDFKMSEKLITKFWPFDY